MDDDNLDDTFKMTNATFNFTLNDTAALIDGFLSAANFSGYVKTYETCKYHHLKLSQDLLDLVEAIKDYSKSNDTIAAYSEILKGFGNVLSGSFVNYYNCQNYSSEFPKLISAITTYFTDPLWFRTFYTNVINNFYFFEAQYAKTAELFKRGEYHDSGHAFGELFMMVIFPTIPKTRLLSANQIVDYVELVKCLEKETGKRLPEIRSLETLAPFIPLVKDVLIKCINNI